MKNLGAPRFLVCHPKNLLGYHDPIGRDAHVPNLGSTKKNQSFSTCIASSPYVHVIGNIQYLKIISQYPTRSPLQATKKALGRQLESSEEVLDRRTLHLPLPPSRTATHWY